MRIVKKHGRKVIPKRERINDKEFGDAIAYGFYHLLKKLQRAGRYHQLAAGNYVKSKTVRYRVHDMRYNAGVGCWAAKAAFHVKAVESKFINSEVSKYIDTTKIDRRFSTNEDYWGTIPISDPRYLKQLNVIQFITKYLSAIIHIPSHRETDKEYRQRTGEYPNRYTNIWNRRWVSASTDPSRIERNPDAKYWLQVLYEKIDEQGWDRNDLTDILEFFNCQKFSNPRKVQGRKFHEWTTYRSASKNGHRRERINALRKYFNTVRRRKMREQFNNPNAAETGDADYQVPYLKELIKTFK